VNPSAKCSNGDGIYPDLESGCTKFYQCTYTGTSNQIVQTFVCPSLTLYDPVIKSCNFAPSVKCSSPNPITVKPITYVSQVTQSNLFTTSNASPSNVCLNGDGFYPDIKSGCAKFFQCTGSGTSQQALNVFQCAPPTIFDAVYKTCNYPDQVKCGLSQASNRHYSRRNLNTGKCLKDGYFADLQSDCKKFYKCSYTGTANQAIQYFDCPLPNIFDEILGSCNYPHLVKCGNTLKADENTSKSENELTTKCFKGNLWDIFDFFLIISN
jgi:hypothetical protein